jgi:hypothetical protein
MLLTGAVVAICLKLVPLASDIPSAEALMPGIVACKMAVLHEAMLSVAAGERDLLINTHRGECIVWLLRAPYGRNCRKG